jgi:hypothetical protein
MATPKLRDLDSYIRTGGRKCATCESEHRAFIEKAHASGYGLSTILAYLNKQFDAGLKSNTIYRHFRERHHE